MATRGDIKAKARPVKVAAVRHEVPVTVVYSINGEVTPVDYSDMTAEQARGIVTEFHVTAIICRTCGDQAPHCPDIAAFFS